MSLTQLYIRGHAGITHCPRCDHTIFLKKGLYFQCQKCQLIIKVKSGKI